MVINVTTEKDFVTKCLTMLGALSKWSKKETDVAIAMVLVYRMLQKRKTMQDENTPEEDRIDVVMDKVKQKEVLANLALYLDMPFTSFRNYVSKLKSKGFFIDGTINPMFLLEGSSISVEITKQMEYATTDN